MHSDAGFELGNLKDMFVRRWRVVAGVAGGVLLASVMLAALLPNRYEAYTTILIEPQTISNEIIEAGVAQTDMNARLHLMTIQILARTRLSRIIDDLNLYADESTEMTREEIIDLMRADIQVEPILPELEASVRPREIEINTFRIIYRGDHPKRVAEVANRLANDFRDEHIRGRTAVTEETREFVEGQLTRLADEIESVDREISAVKSDNPGRLPEDLATNQRQLERVTTLLTQAEHTLAISRSDEAFYRQQASSARALAAPNDDASPIRRLELVELELAALRSRGFTEKHPDIIHGKLELEEIQKRIDEMTATAKDDAQAGLSLPAQNAEAEYRRAKLRVTSGIDEIANLQKQRDDLQKAIAETPAVAEKLASLGRKNESLTSSYHEFRQKLVAAGVAKNIEQTQKSEQVRILEPAFIPPEPASPNRILILLVGSMFGMAIGAGAGLFAESSDTSYHGVREIQASLQLPVLAAIPGIEFESDRSALRRKRVLIAFAIMVLVGFVLMTSGVGYWWTNIRALQKQKPVVVETVDEVAPGATENAAE